MKLTLLSVSATLLAITAFAVDATPPSLSVTHAWIEKVGTQHAFKLLLDPQDETGVDKIQHRFKVNSSLPLPDTTAWVDYAWQRGTPLRVQAVATSMVIEVRALDAAGNPSPLQRRAFASPLPVSAAPNLEPKFVAEKLFPGSGPSLDCRGLFGGDFDGDGRDDILQVDRASGIIKVRRQQSNGTYVSNGFNVATDAVTDSAVGDFNNDDRPDIALVINGALVVYQNDGLNVTTLQFSVMNVAGLATTGITTVVGVAAGDVTGEGRDDLVISGTGTDTRIAVLLHNDQFQLSASNYAVAPATSTAGAVRLGDVTGDGWTDAVMIDAANNQVLLFMNKANGSFGGADDTDTAARPIATSTGSVAAQSIAVGDVTGDGRADMVITKHQFGDFFVTGEFRDNLFVQFFDSRGAAPFRSNGLMDGGFGPVVASTTPFRSDTMLMDLNDDRFPEIVIASPFIGGTGGVRAWRMNCELDNANLATFVASYSFSYTTGAASPHRLARARFQSSRADVMLASAENAEAVQFVLSTYSPSSKTYDLITGASTDSDDNGSVGTNGSTTFSVDVGGVITYSLGYVNNTTTAVTGGVVDCLLPASLSLESADDGHTIVPSGTSKFIRWTLDVPAGTSGVKTFSVRVLSGANGGKLALTGNFKRGTTPLVAKPMPVVELGEPLGLTVTTTTTSDSFGQRAHIGETITYRFRVKNFGTGTISNFKFGMSAPAGTTVIGSTPSASVVTGTFPNITALTWNNLSLLPDAQTILEVRVQVKSNTAVGTIIKNTTATVTRADLQKVVAPAVNVRIDPPLEITLSSNKNIVQPGDTIRYTFTVQNWLATPVTNAKVVNKLPTGVALLTAAANDAVDSSVGGAGNFVYSQSTWTAAQLSTTTLPAYDRSMGIMTWVLNTVPAGVTRQIQFDVVVATDIPTFANISGVSTTLEVQNKSYNFVASSPTGVRIFAAAAVGGSAANALTAASDKLLSNVLTVRRSLLSDPPLASPNLSLLKRAYGDGKTNIAGEDLRRPSQARLHRRTQLDRLSLL
ncbi:MAG: FG-GAP-like repeat-containing protein [Verrucomicrobia bacterium]|nr:FG-GAP-like repeat-containing protein [Verrucomicrobiota bacterium]